MLVNLAAKMEQWRVAGQRRAAIPKPRSQFIAEMLSMRTFDADAAEPSVAFALWKDDAEPDGLGLLLVAGPGIGKPVGRGLSPAAFLCADAAEAEAWRQIRLAVRGMPRAKGTHH
jgi:hypothetical protein